MKGIVQGSTITGVGNATASDVVKGKTCMVDVGSITGTLEPAATDIKTGVTIAGVTGTYDTEATHPITAATVLLNDIGWVNGSKITGTMPNKGGTTVVLSYTTQSVIIPKGYYDGESDTKAVLSLVSSGNNQVYIESGNTQSGTYVTLSSATVNYNGTYKITIVVSANAGFDALGVKVNGVAKLYTTGTTTFDLTLSKSGTLIVEGFIDSIYSAVLTVDITAKIAEPAAFIA